MNKEKTRYDFIDIIGNSDTLLKCKEKAYRASKTSSSVLIYGETGTGKELFVQSIHNNSERRNKPFIAQNCAAMPANLLESMLFGTAKGSFTSAENRKGLFEIADGGTLYLDELNSMPIELQAKLLRVLQEGSIRRVGDNNLKYIDVRIIASLNEEPEGIVECGKLRSDLYYRLNVVRIDIPALRKRKEDIPLLINHFINKYNEKFDSSIEGIEKKALDQLIQRQWEGNVRELEHFVERTFNFKKEGLILFEDIEDEFKIKSGKAIIPLRQRLEEVEEDYIKEAMILSDGNVSKAAKLLDIPRQTLQYKIKKIKDGS